MIWRRVASAAVAAIAVSTMTVPAAGQTSQQETDELRKELEAVKRRVEELEGGKAGDARVSPSRKRVRLEIGGHVNRAYLYADNGTEGDSFFVDNDNSGTRFWLRGETDAGNWTAGSSLAINFESNSTDDISFGDTEPVIEDSADGLLSLREAEVYFKNKRIGSFYLGHGSEAANGAMEVDLSGTTLIAESDVDDTAGGLEFDNGTELDQYFRNLDGGRTSRVAYRTPRVGGFKAAVALRQENGVQPDFGLTYAGEFSGWELEAAVGFRTEDEPGAADDSNVITSSASLLAPFGLNLTIGASSQDFDDDVAHADQNATYLKLGYRAKFFDAGETRFSVDYFTGDSDRDSVAGDPTGTESIGGGVVQVVKNLSTELYIGARVYSIDLPGVVVDPDDLTAFITGARVRF